MYKLYGNETIRPVDVVLVQMPYTWLNPSLALGLLKADVSSEGISNEVIYASHHYVEILGVELFTKAENYLEAFHSSWEMLFAAFTDFTPQKSAAEVLKTIASVTEFLVAKDGKRYPSTMIYDLVMDIWPELMAKTDEFLDIEVEEIMRRKPRIVACSILTQQRNASFALFKRLKEKDPGLITILGGSCCTGEVGATFVERIPTLDYVFSGEGDGALGAGMQMILDGRIDLLKKEHPEFLTPGSCVVNKYLPDMNDSPIPDFKEFYEQVARDTFISDNIGNNGKILLIMEASRGCWWGEKGKCRFCGLHNSKEALCYRPKKFERVWEEAKELSKKYDYNFFIFTDCILDYRFIRSLPEEAPEDRKHLKIIAECKSNVKDHEMRKLKHNGFISLQAGIESLSEGMLKLMNKGAHTIDQLACLKYSRKYGIRMFWNLLVGFPGEDPAWYDDMLELMSHIHHFQPPTGFSEMMLVRNSVYYEDHDAYGIHNIQTRVNEQAIDPDEDFSRKTANYFYTPDIKQYPQLHDELGSERERWMEDFSKGLGLRHAELDGCIILKDTRDGSYKKVYRLEGIKKDLYMKVQETASEKKVIASLKAKYSEEEIKDTIDYLCGKWFIYKGDGRVLALSIPDKCEEYASYD